MHVLDYWPEECYLLASGALSPQGVAKMAVTFRCFTSRGVCRPLNRLHAYRSVSIDRSQSSLVD